MTKKKILNNKFFAPIILIVFMNSFLFSFSYARAEEKLKPDYSPPRHYLPSTNLTGALGLTTLPSARMDERGAIRVGVTASDPYVHSYLGFQLATPLYVAFRQTSEVSSLTQDPDASYPGIDLRLRLMEETATRPALVVGADSALGHKRMASEYLTFSKRFGNFDLTGGMAWGRLGSAAHIENPLKAVSSHFGKSRDYDSLLNSQNVDNWFTGEDIGFFGGVEYFTSLKGLSLKAEYGADDYVAEEKEIAAFRRLSRGLFH